MDELHVVTATIASGDHTSSEIRLDNRLLRGLEIAYTALTPCYFGIEYHFDGDKDGGGSDIWYKKRNQDGGAAGRLLSAEAIDGAYSVILKPEVWGLGRADAIRINCLAADGSTPVTQAADRTLKVIVLA